MKSIQDTAAWDGRNRFGRPFSRLNVDRQLQVLIAELGTSPMRGSKRVSQDTIQAREHVLRVFFANVRSAGFDVQTVLNLAQKHVAVALRQWVAEELSASTIQTRISILRWFATAIGKPAMIGDPTAYGVPEPATDRSVVVDGGLPAAHDPNLVIEKIADACKMDLWVGTQLAMANAFGLRVSEAIMIKPHQADHGGAVRIEAGTKSGRTRVVEIRTPAQLEVLRRAKEVAGQSLRGSLCPPEMKLRQAKNRLYYVCRKLGLTKTVLGLTPQSLRYQYIHQHNTAASDGSKTTTVE